MQRTERDYLNITVDDARLQWRDLKSRSFPQQGKRQVAFVPVETLLSLAVSYVVNHRALGKSSLQPSPLPQLAHLFKRSPRSVPSKIANLDGSRPNGARLDLLTGTRLRADPQLFAHIYRVVFAAARAEGIGNSLLPDFLNLEVGGQMHLLGQEKLDSTTIEDAYEAEIVEWQRRLPSLTERETERLYMTTTRVGQHLFAQGVLGNCRDACVFCGMTSPPELGATLLVASHIKPWRDSAPSERLDVRNGIAACPTHDRAFDLGLITLTEELEVERSFALSNHLAQDTAARAAFGSPPLRGQIDLSWLAEGPKLNYVTWHRERIFLPHRAPLRIR